MLQLKIPHNPIKRTHMPQQRLKIPRATTKTQHSQKKKNQPPNYRNKPKLSAWYAKSSPPTTLVSSSVAFVLVQQNHFYHTNFFPSSLPSLTLKCPAPTLPMQWCLANTSSSSSMKLKYHLLLEATCLCLQGRRTKSLSSLCLHCILCLFLSEPL